MSPRIFARALSTANRRRVALVTGAAQGIGRGIASRLAKDGFDVAINDLSSNSVALDELAQGISESSGGRCISVLGDVASEADVVGMVKTCASDLGSLDVMVANAGIAVVKPLLETSTEEFDRVISVNLRGVMLCYKYAALQMVEQGWGGHIIGACSANGKTAAANISAYSASKFAVRGLTQSAALELGKYGIRVNAYAPARILTPMLQGYDVAITSQNSNMIRGDFLEQLRKATVFGQLGGPEEVASLVSYLVSPEAHFITGQTFSVNGGSQVD